MIDSNGHTVQYVINSFGYPVENFVSINVFMFLRELKREITARNVLYHILKLLKAIREK